jgi:hypothetical protein
VKRTHTVSQYRRAEPAAQASPYADASAGSAWGGPVAVDVGCNLQPLTGSVRESAAGAEVNADWKGFFPSAIALEAGDGLVVTDGVGPQRFLVQQVGAQGGRWDTEALLSSVVEAIP